MADKIKTLISQEEVMDRIAQLGEQISQDYAGRSVHLVGILKGGVFFLCELAKHITVPVSIDFMAVSSYGDGTESTGRVKITKDLDESIRGKDVIIVEDIVDSGRTLHNLCTILEQREPKSLEIATLLDKPDRREFPMEIKYTCHQIPDVFVVGFGLDYAQKYRNLPFIGYVEV